MNFDRAASRRRARRDRRAARGAARGRDPRAARRVPAFCEALGERNVTEFNYRYATVHDGAHLRRRRAADAAARSGASSSRSSTTHGYRRARHERQRDGEAARALHGRRPSAGPRARAAVPLRVPGAPGRAARVPQGDRRRWNISLFHYRNHGSDYGRVLAGVQVPAADRASSRSTSRSSATCTGTRPRTRRTGCS